MAEQRQSAQGQKRRRRPPVTGLRVDRELIKRAKFRALQDDKTLTRVVEEAIDLYLRSR